MSKNSNLLIITIDSLGSDQVSKMINSDMFSNFNNLLKTGIYFSKSVSSSDSTGSSLGSIFTGKYPFKNKIGHFRFNSKIKTLFDKLSEKEYSLYSITPDIMFFMELTKKFTKNIHYTYDERESWNGLNHEIGNQILDELNKHNKKSPWLLYIHLMDLHLPLKVPKNFNYNKNISNDFEKILCVLDFWIGKIIERVDLEKTTVIITSDHGEYVPVVENFSLQIPNKLKGLKKILPKNLADSMVTLLQKENKKSIKRKNKNKLNEVEFRTLLERNDVYLYDQIILTPLIILNKNFKKGKIINQQVRHVDIFSTILDILQIENEEKIDGISLKPLIMEKKIDEEIAVIETAPKSPKEEVGKIIGLRTSDYKYLRSRKNSNEFISLYNIKLDPLEKNNIKNSEKAIVKKYENLLSKLLKDENQEIVKEFDEKCIEEELKKLGYM
jgi:arylsulfatase A-like enzyme